MGSITILIISFGIRTVLLTLMLWVMVKFQKLNSFFVGLLVSAALACALDLVPYAGHFLAVAVLYFCIWKISGASPFPAPVFTAVIPYALVFAVNMFCLTALLDKLRPHVANNEPLPSHPVVAVTNHVTPPSLTPSATVARATNRPAVAVTQTVTNQIAVPTISPDELLKNVVASGATENGDKSLLVIVVKKKTYTLSMDEDTVVPLTNGPCHLRLLDVNGSWAKVSVNGEAAYLQVH